MLKHVSFLTRDLGATLAFYAALGGTVEKDLLTSEGYRRGVVRFGPVGGTGGTAPEAGRLQFFEVPGEGPAPHPHWAEHVALHVRGLAGLLSALRAQGVRVTRDLQPSPGGRPMAFVLDPDGRQVELLEVEESGCGSPS